jgi:conjugal transfer pilus assembly protein TraW
MIGRRVVARAGKGARDSEGASKQCERILRGLGWPVVPCRALAWGVVIAMATLLVRGSAQDILAPGQTLDPATQALIEEMGRKAGEVAAAPDRRAAAAAILERARAAAMAVRDGEGSASPATLPKALERARAAAAAVTGVRAPAVASPGPPTAGPAERPLILFVSWSMGEEGLVESLRAAASDGRTRVVLRGVLPGERIGDAVRRVAPLVRDRVPGGSIDFDPPAFRRAGVFAVPTIFDPASGSQWRGSAALAGFRRRLADAPAKFSDQVGPETVIAEPDLEEVMKAQAAALDFRGMRDRAYRAFWQNVELVPLPAAQSSLERAVDPTVVTTGPLEDGQGRPILAAGMPINALAAHPWSHRLIVFDASDPAQLAWAARQARDGQATIFLTSSVDRDAGWDGWQRLVSTLRAPLFVLERQLAERLTARVVPSVFVQDGSLLRVDEIGRDELQASAAISDQGGGDASRN